MNVPIPIMFLGLVFVNVIGLWFANYFRLLIFLDTVATAVVGMYFGTSQPWGIFSGVMAGAVVGFLTNLFTGWKYPAYLKFLHVNVLCGIIWGLLPILCPLPSVSGPEAAILLYILGFGAMVGLVSAIAAVPVRIFCTKFQSDHLLDQISQSIWDNSPDKHWVGFFKILSAEYLLSHCLDKILAMTLAVIYVLQTHSATETAVPLTAIYRNLMDLLAAYYFVALAIAVKSLGATPKMDSLFLLLGPLGFFSVLMAAPEILMIIS